MPPRPRVQNQYSGFAQPISHSGRQRRLGPDDHEINRIFFGKADNSPAVFNIQSGTIRDLRDPRIPRSNDQAITFGVLQHCPCQAVFAPSAAENEDIHESSPICLALPARRSKLGAHLKQGAEMSDLLDDPIPGQNTPEYTVSEISGEVKRTLEGSFGRIRVRGEVGRVFKARSGHLYYDIKDDRNVLACTTWKGQISGLSVVPEEGLEVVVTGRLTAFGAQSKYNLNVDEVSVAGQGALMALLEKRKKQLESEGLFAPERKKPLPYLPQIIGVVTSPSGAVIRDILHRLRDRFPRKVLIWPVAVQGANCAPEVARAIEGFNQLTPGGALPRPDLIIVARGGGSIEDLWGFNEEIVARAAAASDIPLISAVGHETDTTLIDFVSDQRAPTPTAAAELAVPVRMELLARPKSKPRACPARQRMPFNAERKGCAICPAPCRARTAC